MLRCLHCFYCFSLAEKDESIKVTTRKDKKITAVKSGKATKAKVPLTGTEVVQILAKKRELGEFELYHLKEVEGDVYRYSVIRLPSSLSFQTPIDVIMLLFHSAGKHTVKL